MNMNFLPSLWVRRIIIITLSLIIVGFSIYTIIERQKERSEQKNRGIDIVFLEDEERSDVDTDMDGLPDWEEILWGLNPYLADTDSDGVDDAQYVRNRKNIQERRDAGFENYETNMTESERLGRSIYTAILAIEESGGTLDLETRDQISNNIAEYVKQIPVSGRLYVRDELNLVENTRELTRKYQQEMESLLSKYPVETADIQLLVESLESDEPRKSELKKAAEKYDILVNELVSLDVPYAIGARHTELLNSISHVAGSLKNLSADEQDELLTLSTIIQMDDRLNQVRESAFNIQAFFEIIADDTVFEDQNIAEA